MQKEIKVNLQEETVFSTLEERMRRGQREAQN